MKMYEKTNFQINLSIGRRLTLAVSWLRLTVSLLLGKLHLRSSSITLWARYQEKLDLMHSGALSENLISSWTTDNADIRGGELVYARKIENERLDDTVLSDVSKQKYRYQRVAPFLDSLLKNDGSIKCVMHIGGRIDTVSAFFSKRYKDKIFVTVDMQSNLKTFNDKLGVRKNWLKKNAYALNLLHEREFAPDLGLMIATSLKFNNAEFHAYLRQFASLKTKHLIFFEPWWPIPFLLRSIFTITPSTISNDISPIGGQPCDFHHNYGAILNEYGYEIQTASIDPAPMSNQHNDLFIHATLSDLGDR